MAYAPYNHAKSGMTGLQRFAALTRAVDQSESSRHLKDMPPGNGFGEIALIYNQPRTSTVIAKTAVEA